MHSSSLELGRKSVELNVCESFIYFTMDFTYEKDFNKDSEETWERLKHYLYTA